MQAGLRKSAAAPPLRDCKPVVLPMPADEEVGKLEQQLEREDLGAALEGLRGFQADVPA